MCARIVAGFQIAAGPQGDVSEQPSSSQTFWIAGLTHSPFYSPISFFFLSKKSLRGSISIPPHKVLCFQGTIPADGSISDSDTVDQQLLEWFLEFPSC